MINYKETLKSPGWKYAVAFTVAVILGIINAFYPTNFGLEAAQFISDVFVRLFKFISVPLIGITICTTIANLGNQKSKGKLVRKTLFYTISTTVLAALVGCILYKVISPSSLDNTTQVITEIGLDGKTNYLNYFLSIVPDNPITPITSGKVLSILLIAIFVGLAVPQIKDVDQRVTISNFLSGIQSILFTLIKWLIKVLPIGIFGFISICAKEIIDGNKIGPLAEYVTVVLGANAIQGLIVLPLLLLIKRINPIKTAFNMGKALLIAFFTKSSAGTLPMTISCAENNNGVHPTVARFVLPICTTINMNGCAAFILITSLYLMQNAGIEITATVMITWVYIATIAAIGNAGVPMGCYFLTASLLASMDVPIQLLGVILPIYALIDMVETGLNVWSDSTVATIVNKDMAKELEQEDNNC